MFSGLRENSIFYVLDKTNGATLKTGQVIQVSNPQPKFPQYQPGQYNIQAVETTVDIKVRMPDGDMEFRHLPSNAQIDNSGNVVVSGSKDAMMAEVEAMQKRSKDVLQSREYHEKTVEDCERIKGELNPQIAKDKIQQQKITKLEEEISGVKGALTNIETMLQKALTKKSS